MICYKVESGVAINLYTRCPVRTRVASDVLLTLHQRTDFSSSGAVAIFLEPDRAAKFPVWLCIPRWCTSAKAKINGPPLKHNKRMTNNNAKGNKGRMVIPWHLIETFWEMS